MLLHAEIPQTEKLFYQDVYLQDTTATVLACEATRDGFAVVLDRTVFYPEGGGQYGDHGRIDEIPVTDCYYQDEVICHLCTRPLPVGKTVRLMLDWDLRYRRMQEHSGEHLISGIIYRDFGYDNVGFHMGSEAVTIDYNGPINADQLLAIEDEANTIIYQNRPIEILYPDDQELSSYQFRSKKELTGKIRLVRVPSCDLCACCGTHVRTTGEIGLIHFTSAIRYKGGVRLTLQLGRNALEDYRRKDNSLKQLSALLNVPMTNCVERTGNLLEKLNTAEQSILLWQQRYIEERLTAATAAGADTSERQQILLCELEAVAPSLLARLITAAPVTQTLVVINKQETAQLCTIRSETLPLADICKALKADGCFRGGGRGSQIQGELLCSVTELIAKIQIFTNH